MKVETPSRAPRMFSDAAVSIDAELRLRRLAPPGRRIGAFACDVFVVAFPSLALTLLAATLSLALTEPEAARALVAVANGSADPALVGPLAPLLVRIDAAGLPPAVALAVEEHDLRRAGELLANHMLLFKIGGDAEPGPPGSVRLDVVRLVPSPLRWLSTFGAAAAYFTFFAAGRRHATPGKRLLGLRVLKLDGRPLTVWESFERFGGYFISVGTFGLGLLDLWRDPNRRLAHDRVSNTVVVAAD